MEETSPESIPNQQSEGKHETTVGIIVPMVEWAFHLSQCRLPGCRPGEPKSRRGPVGRRLDQDGSRCLGGGQVEVTARLSISRDARTHWNPSLDGTKSRMDRLGLSTRRRPRHPGTTLLPDPDEPLASTSIRAVPGHQRVRRRRQPAASKGTLLNYWKNFVPASEFWLTDNEW